MCLKKEKSVSVFLLPGLFVILWRGGFGLGSGRVQAVALRSEQEVRVAAGRARGRGLARWGAAPWYPNPKCRAGLVTVVRVSSQRLADKSPPQ